MALFVAGGTAVVKRNDMHSGAHWLDTIFKIDIKNFPEEMKEAMGKYSEAIEGINDDPEYQKAREKCSKDYADDLDKRKACEVEASGAFVYSRYLCLQGASLERFLLFYTLN